MKLFNVRFEEQAHMHDYSAGIFTSKAKAEEVLATVLNNPQLKCYEYAWIEELELDKTLSIEDLTERIGQPRR